MLEIFKKKIASALAQELSFLSKEEIEGMLEVPPKPELGDIAFPCFSLAKHLKKNPAQIAEELKEKIEGKIVTQKLPELQEIETINGYLNFFINSNLFAKEMIANILKEKEKYGFNNIGKKQKVMIEYSAPNTNKPLHIGHLRNGAIGMCLSNMLAFSGYDIIRANVVNDRGIHICQSMLAYKKLGENKTPESEKLKGDKFVGQYYVLFHQKAKEDPSLEERVKEMLLQWEKEDKEIRALWKKMNAWVLQGFKETYKNFGSEFDEWFFESKFYDKAKPLIDVGLTKGIFGKDAEGRIMALLEKYGLPNKTVMRADGTSIYLTNDLALTKHKFEKFKLNKSIWVVASEQNLYFQQLFKILELLGFGWAKDCEHLSYGLVFLPEGKMKSREGKVIDADDLLAETIALAKQEILKREQKISEKELEKRAHAVAVAAITFAMLSADYKRDFTFVAEKSVSFEGNSGPYLQYSYARAKSILRAAEEKVNIAKADFSLLATDNEKQLFKLLSEFSEIILHSTEKRELHAFCQYLLGLSNTFNSFYHESPVLKADEKIRHSRLLLVMAFSQVLKNGLMLLNITPLEKM